MQQNFSIVSINGLKCLYKSTFSVLELTKYMGFNENIIVIDYNGYILDANSWDKTLLKDKDTLEILSMAGGG